MDSVGKFRDGGVSDGIAGAKSIAEDSSYFTLPQKGWD
jgi:hypothetical protein